MSLDETPPAAPEAPLLLSVQSVAERLSVSIWTVYDLCQSGRLRSTKIGTRRLVSAEALREYVDGLPEGAAS